MLALLKEVWLTAKKALTTLSGVLISFTLQQPKKAKKLVLSYLPQQDLNGYSKPWLGGNGKNRFSFNAGDIYVYPSTGLTIEKDDNSLTMTATGTTGAQVYRFTASEVFDSTKTYTFSCKAKKIIKGTAGSPCIQVIFYGSNDNTNFTNISMVQISPSNTVEGREETLSKSISGYVYYRFSFYNNANTPVTVGEQTSYYDIMFEEGNTPTAYEPYSNICAITGRSNDKTVVSGKNRFSFSAGTQFLSPAPYVSAETTDNSVTLTATGTGGAQYMRIALNEVFDLAKSYALSFKAKKIVKGTNGRPWIQVVPQGSHDNSNWTSLTKLENQNPTQGTEYTFSGVYTGYEYYRFYIYNNTNTPVTVGEKTAYYDIQFEEGNTATEFEPTLSTEYDSNYGSTLYGGSYDIVSGKLADYYEVVELGDKSWTRGSNGVTGHYRYYCVLNGAQEPVASKLSDPNSVCTGFSLVETTWNNLETGYTITNTDGTGYVHIYSAAHDGLTAAQFKTAMAGVKLCYRKVTPVISSLTESQVELYQGINNIVPRYADETTVVYESEV